MVDTNDDNSILGAKRNGEFQCPSVLDHERRDSISDDEEGRAMKKRGFADGRGDEFPATQANNAYADTYVLRLKMQIRQRVSARDKSLSATIEYVVR